MHYTRDNPNVPSDLEQMPSLLKFITGSGTLIAQEHTPLIAHTANDIVTSETGLYGSDQGIPVANEYQYYTSAKDGSTDEAGAFAYWTDPIVDYDTAYAGTPVGDAPPLWSARTARRRRPWVSYTRAGLQFRLGRGGRHRAGEPGPGRRQGIRRELPGRQGSRQPQASSKAAADYEGLSVHCARGSALCAQVPLGPDLLPDEPGGYSGYRALFGAKYLDPLHVTRPGR